MFDMSVGHAFFLEIWNKFHGGPYFVKIPSDVFCWMDVMNCRIHVLCLKKSGMFGWKKTSISLSFGSTIWFLLMVSTRWAHKKYVNISSLPMSLHWFGGESSPQWQPFINLVFQNPPVIPNLRRCGVKGPPKGLYSGPITSIYSRSAKTAPPCSGGVLGQHSTAPWKRRIGESIGRKGNRSIFFAHKKLVIFKGKLPGSLWLAGSSGWFFPKSLLIGNGWFKITISIHPQLLQSDLLDSSLKPWKGHWNGSLQGRSRLEEAGLLPYLDHPSKR